MESPYEILGVSPGETDLRVVKKAYGKLLRIHRPERDPEGFRRIRDAYETIKSLIENNNSWLSAIYPNLSPGQTFEFRVNDSPRGYSVFRLDAASDTSEHDTVFQSDSSPDIPSQDLERLDLPRGWQSLTKRVRKEIKLFALLASSISELENELLSSPCELANFVGILTSKVNSRPDLVPLWYNILADVFANDLSVIDEGLSEKDLLASARQGYVGLCQRMIGWWWQYGGIRKIIFFARLWEKSKLGGRETELDVCLELAYYLAIIHPNLAESLLDKAFSYDSRYASMYWPARGDHLLLLAEDIRSWPIANRFYIARSIVDSNWHTDNKVRDLADSTLLRLSAMPRSSGIREYITEFMPQLAKDIEQKTVHSREEFYSAHTARETAKSGKKHGGEKYEYKFWPPPPPEKKPLGKKNSSEKREREHKLLLLVATLVVIVFHIVTFLVVF